jgi:hypothetical protein
MRKEEQPIEETIRLLTELVEGQQKALDMANNLLDMKSRLIELYEEEVEVYQKNMKINYRINVALCILLAISSMLHIIRL